MKLQIVNATKGVPKGLTFDVTEPIGAGSTIEASVRGSMYRFLIDVFQLNPDGTFTVSNSNLVATLRVVE